jgi:hypothetical protein
MIDAKKEVFTELSEMRALDVVSLALLEKVVQGYYDQVIGNFVGKISDLASIIIELDTARV